MIMVDLRFVHVAGLLPTIRNSLHKICYRGSKKELYCAGQNK